MSGCQQIARFAELNYGHVDSQKKMVMLFAEPRLWASSLFAEPRLWAASSIGLVCITLTLLNGQMIPP
jgi:hypothetical protein